MSTYVLVHGAWHSGRAWDRVVPLLTAAGHEVFAPSLTGHGDTAGLMRPGVGLDTYVEDLARLFTGRGLAEVVLVGHSFAGMIISSVANRMPERVAHLVYLDAMDPTDGQAALDVAPAAQSLIDEAAASDAPWRLPPLPPAFFGVTEPADVAWLHTILTDEPAQIFQQPAKLGNPAAETIPATYIRCVDHRSVPGAPQPVPGTRPNGGPVRVWELESGHDCMITTPSGLAEILLKIT
ncbi:esterase [Actinoplanes sp. NBRC 14428]|uniref:Pimeloyl-ACP methyl ester carboxylesterase n=1 Tax=Pseudosporangium ferrugineum TaxID=439699 RepID=A0A2T0RII2_9ACTN|nr:alpha/beta fold hydrolase [Pseudosporangium ferrugineum]PRY21014.1 pimeloyl-ACP methyl ester carboxylesterase [Pseudosporangium ferrugineum]BCJ51900.1 esterase [Actinoplanes sp. NBRC 14428]